MTLNRFSEFLEGVRRQMWLSGLCLRCQSFVSEAVRSLTPFWIYKNSALKILFSGREKNSKQLYSKF